MLSHTLTDQVLVKNFLKGDNLSFEHLLNRHKNRVFAFVMSKVKNRDFWMPFAPIILDEYQDEILVNPKKIECPYMTIGFDTINGNEKIPAAVHQADYTVRPLILNRQHNSKI